MTTRTTNLLAFMTDAPEGTYEVTKPTDEQLAAVLPWLIDSTIVFARKQQLCGYVNEALPAIIGHLGGPEKVTKFYSADGYNCEGYDREGYNRDGFDSRGYNRDGYAVNGRDRNGFDRNGFDRNGYNKDGFNVDGRDRNGDTRDDAIAKLVGGWSKSHLDAVAVRLAERAAAKAAAEANVAVETAPTEELANAAA